MKKNKKTEKTLKIKRYLIADRRKDKQNQIHKTLLVGWVSN